MLIMDCKNTSGRMRAPTIRTPNGAVFIPSVLPVFVLPSPFLHTRHKTSSFSPAFYPLRSVVVHYSVKKRSMATMSDTGIYLLSQSVESQAVDIKSHRRNDSKKLFFPWLIVAVTVFQISIIAVAVSISVQIRRTILAYILPLLALPQLLLTFLRLREYFIKRRHARLAVVDGDNYEEITSGATGSLNEFDISIRSALAREFQSFRYEISRFQKLSLEREEARNLSVSKAVSALDSSVSAMREDMERRDLMRPTVPYATLQQVETLKARLSLFERENSSLKQQLRAVQFNYESSLQNADQTRREATESSIREISAREELAIAQARLLHLNDVSERLNRAEITNKELQEKLLSRIREEESLKLSANDTSRRLARVREVSQLLQKKLVDFTSGSSSGLEDDTVPEEEANEAEKGFWQKRLKNRGNLGRSSVVYQELLRGSKEATTKEWPSDPLGEDAGADQKSKALQGLPEDGGFGGSDVRLLLSESAEDRNELSGDKSDSNVEDVFSFSRGEFESKSLTGANEASESQIQDSGYSPRPNNSQAASADPITTASEGKAGYSKSDFSSAGSSEKEEDVSQSRNKKGSESYLLRLEKESNRTARQKESSASSVTDAVASQSSLLSSETPITAEKRKVSEDVKVRENRVDSSTNAQTKNTNGKTFSKSSPSTYIVTNNRKSRSPTLAQKEEAAGIQDASKRETEEAGGSKIKTDSPLRGTSFNQERGQASGNATAEKSAKPHRAEGGKVPQSFKSNKPNILGEAENLDMAQKMRSNAPAKATNSLEIPVVTADLPWRVPESVGIVCVQNVKEAANLVEESRAEGLTLVEMESLLQEARRKLENCLRIGYHHPAARGALGECLVLLAKLNLRDERARWYLWKAMTYLEGSVKALPNDENILFNRGLCHAVYASLSTHDTAIKYQLLAAQHFDKLLEMNPKAQVAAYNGGLSYFCLARCYIGQQSDKKELIQKYLENAIARFEKGVRLNPEDRKNATYLDAARKELKEGRKESTK